MPNQNARKGAAWETAVKKYMAEVFGAWRVRRPRQSGTKDVGDLHLDAGVVAQLKDVTALNVTGWLADVEKQRGHAEGRWGVVIWKRRQRPTGEAVVFMDLKTFREILAIIAPPPERKP